MNLRDAIYKAESLGITVRKVNRNGETDFIVPGGYPRLRINRRRESAPKKLESFLRQYEQGKIKGVKHDR